MAPKEPVVEDDNIIKLTHNIKNSMCTDNIDMGSVSRAYTYEEDEVDGYYGDVINNRVGKGIRNNCTTYICIAIANKWDEWIVKQLCGEHYNKINYKAILKYCIDHNHNKYVEMLAEAAEATDDVYPNLKDNIKNCTCKSSIINKYREYVDKGYYDDEGNCKSYFDNSMKSPADMTLNTTTYLLAAMIKNHHDLVIEALQSTSYVSNINYYELLKQCIIDGVDKYAKILVENDKYNCFNYSELKDITDDMSQEIKDMIKAKIHDDEISYERIYDETKKTDKYTVTFNYGSYEERTAIVDLLTSYDIQYILENKDHIEHDIALKTRNINYASFISNIQFMIHNNIEMTVTNIRSCYDFIKQVKGTLDYIDKEKSIKIKIADIRKGTIVFTVYNTKFYDLVMTDMTDIIKNNYICNKGITKYIEDAYNGIVKKHSINGQFLNNYLVKEFVAMYV